jgi:hypothetical protein
VSPGAALGPRTFQIRPPHGHQPWAEARIEVVSAPAAQQPQQPQVSMPKLDIAPPKLRRFEPDVAIVDVKGTGPGSGGVAVTVKNVGNAPTNARCAVFAATYQYNPRNSSPNKWDPQAGCFQQQYEFGVLLPGQSETISACGYPPDKVSPGFWQVYNVGYHCGGESNDSNNKFSIRKEPDAAYFKSFEGQR